MKEQSLQEKVFYGEILPPLVMVGEPRPFALPGGNTYLHFTQVVNHNYPSHYPGTVVYVIREEPEIEDPLELLFYLLGEEIVIGAELAIKSGKAYYNYRQRKRLQKPYAALAAGSSFPQESLPGR